VYNLVLDRKRNILYTPHTPLYWLSSWTRNLIGWKNRLDTKYSSLLLNWFVDKVWVLIINDWVLNAVTRSVLKLRSNMYSVIKSVHNEEKQIYLIFLSDTFYSFGNFKHVTHAKSWKKKLSFQTVWNVKQVIKKAQ